MRLLMVPNWSFGRSRILVNRFRDILGAAPVQVYYCDGDIDHNRTVTAYAGEPDALLAVSKQLMAKAFDAIDLNHHVGEHPRVGALDVCPVTTMPGDASPESLQAAQNLVVALGEAISAYGVPVFFYEKSERGRHDVDLPTLRKGGFGGLLDKELNPDLGPTHAHQQLGVSIVGVRDFLLAINVNLKEPSGGVAKTLARRIRNLRGEIPTFEGVRALGFVLASRHQSQVSLNLTKPDLTPIDPILEWVQRHAENANAAVSSTELIGVIRPKDLEHATKLHFHKEQIVE